jgi:hypothetical protein
MRTSQKSVYLSLGVILFAGVLAFGRSGSETPESRSPEEAVATLPITIGTFSETPPEITGLSCKFSVDAAGLKTRKYIYMNDCGKTAFMKINGVLTKFTNPEFRQYDETTSLAKSKSDQYEMILQVKTGPGTESLPKSGTITVSDKKGREVTTKYYGACGC